MKDLISRQAAIDAVYKCTDIFINNLPVMVDKADAYKALAKLPSAQPEIIRCKDCKYHIDGFFCQVANHHTSDKDCCASVFGAERREDE